MQVTAEEAGRMLREQQRQLNNGRMLPPTLARISQLMKAEAFPICNVGPWMHHIERASFHLVIPAYDPKKDTDGLGYAASPLIDLIRREAKIIDEIEFGYFEDDGHWFANDCIGIGTSIHPMNRLDQYGVFVPAGKLPTAAEIAEAKRKLMLYRDRLITEARDAYDLGPAERAAVIGERHLWAGREAGINESWVHHQHAQEAKQCKSCGKFNPDGIAKCPCGNIINFELHFAIEDEQRRRLAEWEEQQTRPDKKK
jgi:hypothetical protein